MQENLLYEYAVIRVVPRVEREEFLNVGIIVYCARRNFLKTIYVLDERRLLAFTNEMDIEEVANYLHALKRICTGGNEGGTIGMLPLASRFRWLTATRSSVVQTSKVHPGFCEDPDQILDRLYRQLVM